MRLIHLRYMQKQYYFAFGAVFYRSAEVNIICFCVFLQVQYISIAGSLELGFPQSLTKFMKHSYEKLK